MRGGPYPVLSTYVDILVLTLTSEIGVPGGGMYAFRHLALRSFVAPPPPQIGPIDGMELPSSANC
eukprot:scaffold198854_cov61-Attheya_sp.AAC.1